ncbi:ATP-binding protein [uncultured Winogradskyella sp.]|uniref:ATP-binding protein n=1 Tax=uncultured Winogradskyella sp. TaxID=395353 RepID=UPI0026118645|nr:ATP-binding protein [uncultured Winogradskyella sp.]
MEVKSAIKTLYDEIDWLQKVINQVICSYLLQEGHEKRWQDIPVPDLSNSDSPYASIVDLWELDIYHRLAIILAIAPSLRPEVLDVFFGRNQIYDRGFTEFGGVIDKSHSGFLPTGQTLCFLISATEIELKGVVHDILDKNDILIKEQVINLGQTDEYIPNFNGVLSLSNQWLHFFLTGKKLKIEQSAEFPARKITTNMEWEDAVLDDLILEQVMEINTWLNHRKTLMKDWNLEKMIKPGYRTLFYGPPGTGKTLTATLLGKASGKDVYKVDLSMIVSKYIGETEKNLAKIFDIAQHKDWILFFDEADALFGKRTIANSSNDRHANQQTAYLLQRIEDFPGTVILASNLKANMDDAFTRRFQSMIHFTMPSPEERYQIWKNAFSGKCKLHPDIDLWKIAEDYELAGGAIINVLRFCALAAIKRDDTIVTKQELLTGLRREFKKENKTLSVNI